MRPLAMLLVMTVTSLGFAQEPLAPQAPPRAGTMLLPPPQGWRYRISDGPPVQEKRWGLFTAGIVMFSVGWCANLQAGIPTGQWALDVPLFGPLLEIASIGGSGSSPVTGWLAFMLVTDAAVQN